MVIKQQQTSAQSVDAIPQTTSASSGDPLPRLPVPVPVPVPYIEQIRACYQNDLEAFSYYETLVDYIEKGSKKKYHRPGEGRPRVFEARSATSSISYPLSFPFDPLEWSSHPKRPCVVLLEGVPPPDAILQLAQRWNLRPEFFIGHVFGHQSPQRGLYNIPTLPSRQDNIIRINLSSLVKSLVEGHGLASYLEKRSEVEEASRQYEKRLLGEHRYGVTRFREISQHDTHYCSVEQTISFTVVVNNSSWVGIFLTDEGESLLEDARLPWTNYHQGSASLKSGIALGTVPTIPYNMPITSGPFDHRRMTHTSPPESSPPLSPSGNIYGSSGHGTTTPPSTASSFGQLHPLRNIVVRDAIDMQLLYEDPFFLLASLFTASALSFVQLLNYLSESIAEGRSTDIDLLNVKLERLNHCVRLICRVESSIDENLQWIVQGGCRTWPRARSGTDTAKRKEALQRTLRTDHEALQRRCVNIRQNCESAMVFLVSYSQLLCGERGIAQAGEVTRLTKLASFFVPLAFVTSAFGMEVKELQENSISIAAFMVVVVLVLSATYAAIFRFAMLDWLRATWGKMSLKTKRVPQPKNIQV